MKPLQIGLLVLGAAIAGGLAVKMTQPTPIAPTPAPRVIAEVVAPPVVTPVQPPVALPAPVAVEPILEPAKPKSAPIAPRKPSPLKPVVNIVPIKPISVPAPPPYKGPVQDPGPAIASTTPPERPALPDPQPEPVQPAPALEPRRVTIPQGSTLHTRLIETLSSDKLKPGDTFQATLSEPLIVGDLAIAERGARVSGRVVNTGQAGKFQGTSRLELALTSFQSADGQKVAIATQPWARAGSASTNSNAAKIGGGAALGAIIGAIAGGGKGAAIGAGAGAAAGTGVVVLTPAKPIQIPTETVIQFRLANAVTVTERI